MSDIKIGDTCRVVAAESSFFWDRCAFNPDQKFRQCANTTFRIGDEIVISNFEILRHSTGDEKQRCYTLERVAPGEKREKPPMPPPSVPGGKIEQGETPANESEGEYKDAQVSGTAEGSAESEEKGEGDKDKSENEPEDSDTDSDSDSDSDSESENESESNSSGPPPVWAQILMGMFPEGIPPEKFRVAAEVYESFKKAKT